MNLTVPSVQTFINFIKTFKAPSCQLTTGQVPNAGTILPTRCSRSSHNEIKHSPKSNKEERKRQLW